MERSASVQGDPGWQTECVCRWREASFGHMCASMQSNVHWIGNMYGGFNTLMMVDGRYQMTSGCLIRLLKIV